MCFPDEMYVQSAAYHEAGHTVTAVALGMPLRNRGVHVDRRGDGIAFYWYRLPGDMKNSAGDIVERERTIVSTEAGFIAQKKFYLDCPVGGNFNDRDQCIKLLDEMYISRDDWPAAQQRLIAEATGLVEKHWQAIEALAGALWARPWTLRPAEDERQWSLDSMEKWLDGGEVVSILKKFGLQAFIRDEVEGKFCPN